MVGELAALAGAAVGRLGIVLGWAFLEGFGRDWMRVKLVKEVRLDERTCL